MICQQSEWEPGDDEEQQVHINNMINWTGLTMWAELSNSPELHRMCFKTPLQLKKKCVYNLDFTVWLVSLSLKNSSAEGGDVFALQKIWNTNVNWAN